MNNDIAAFGSINICPKCRGTAFLRKYAPQYQRFRAKSLGADVATLVDDLPECLSVTCATCGYVWAEQCADAGEKARADSGATQKLGSLPDRSR